MIYKIAVCDDEQIFVEDIVSKLQNREKQYQITCFCSGDELLGSSMDFDIIFLDIEMPGINGVETAFKLREMNYDGIIIFLTSHTEFMPEAFKVKAFRFLDKPIDSEKFDEALSEAEKEILNTEHILIEDKSKSVYLKLTDIVYIEAYGDGTFIYDKNKNIYNTNKPLKYWKEKIGTDHFFQIHKSIIVSFLFISGITKAGTVCMNNCSRELPVSRRNYSEFKSLFMDYIKKHARFM